MSCVELPCAPTELKLNESTLSSNSLIIPLTTSFVTDISIPALLDSSSSHCFLDSKFVSEHSILTEAITPITLQLFDGSSNSSITYMISLPIRFPTSESFDISFYVTPLDPLCSAVLGYNWLTCYNPLIDWVLGSITFRTPETSGLISDMTSALASTPPMPQPTLNPDSLVALPTLDPPVEPLNLDPPVEPLTPAAPLDDPPWVAFLDTEAFAHACKEEGMSCFKLPNSVSRWSANTSDLVDLSSVPSEYHDVADVFSKSKADTLAPHHPYTLKIEIEEGASLPLGPIYSLSPAELSTL